MRLDNGLLGLGLLLAFVAGGIADQPYQTPSGEPPAGNLVGVADTGFQQETKPLDRAGTQSQIPIMPSDRAEIRPMVGSSGQIIGFSGFNGSGSQTITLVHTGKMQMAVYHIGSSGQIRLVSSRPIDADFSLTLNPTAPLPSEIRLFDGQLK